MQRRLSLLGLVGALALGGAACGDDNGGGDGGTTTDGGDGGTTTDGGDGSTTDGGDGGGSFMPSSLADVAGPLSQAICDKFEECTPFFGMLFSPLSCEDVLGPQFARSVEQLQPEVDAGNLTFDPMKAQACLDALRALSCDQVDLDGGPPFNGIAACREMLTGDKAMGDSCTDDFECAPNLYCDRSMACPGQCAEPIAAGGTCTPGQMCADGQTCFVPRTSMDGTGTCMTPVAEGESCDTESGPPCAGGNRCNAPDGETAGTCGPEVQVVTGVAEGQPCGETGDNEVALCGSGLACQLSTSAGPDTLVGTCRAADLAEGASCPLAFPDPCGDGLYCAGIDLETMPPVTTGTCQPIPGEDEPCGTIAFPTDGPFDQGLCASGFACDQTAASPTCVAPKANGQPCTSNAVCESGYCDRSGGDATGTCADRPACR